MYPASLSLYKTLTDEHALKQLISEQVTERLHLDFKMLPAKPTTTDWNNIKNHLSRYLSAFSNADGGVLVYGIAEKEKNAFVLQPHADYRVLADKMNTSLSRLTSPTNQHAEVRALESFTHIGAGYVLVHVPKAEVVPVQCIETKKYFTRTSESAHPMEHFQIADLFGRRSQPKLRCEIGIERGGFAGQVELTVHLKNNGLGIAKYAFVQIKNSGNFRLKTNFQSWFDVDPLYRQKNKIFTASMGKVIHSQISVPVTSYEVTGGELLSSLVNDSSRTIILAVGAEGCPTTDQQCLVPLGAMQLLLDQPSYYCERVVFETQVP